jgi:hypothetical protein
MMIVDDGRKTNVTTYHIRHLYTNMLSGTRFHVRAYVLPPLLATVPHCVRDQ